MHAPRGLSVCCKTAVLCWLVFFSGCTGDRADHRHESWTARGGGPSSIRYSSLDQIDTTNVEQLEVAWMHRTGDAEPAQNSQIQANPIVVDGTLYGTSPTLKVFAVDAATGEEQWVFDPFPDSLEVNPALNVNRGVTHWSDGDGGRILFTAGSTLYALNRDDGHLVEEFGDGGTASLKQGLGERSEDLYVAATSPGVIYDDFFWPVLSLC